MEQVRSECISREDGEFLGIVCWAWATQVWVDLGFWVPTVTPGLFPEPVVCLHCLMCIVGSHWRSMVHRPLTLGTACGYTSSQALACAGLTLTVHCRVSPIPSYLCASGMAGKECRLSTLTDLGFSCRASVSSHVSRAIIPAIMRAKWIGVVKCLRECWLTFCILCHSSSSWALIMNT